MPNPQPPGGSASDSLNVESSALSVGRLPRDPWAHLRRHTPARIALGRTGSSLPTRELLSFNHDHARARDAVNAPFDAEKLAATVRALGTEAVALTTAVPDRATFLRRPDLGRRLSDDSRQRLAGLARDPCHLVLVISDGLSALAAELQVPPLLAALLPRLHAAGWKLAPVCVVRHARVALLDEIGASCRAQLAAILLGERPGLGTADSLGAYFEYEPRPGRTNADRNCVSNIRPGGLPPAAAAARLFQLLESARRIRSSGVALKEDPAGSPPTPTPELGASE